MRMEKVLDSSPSPTLCSSICDQLEKVWRYSPFDRGRILFNGTTTWLQATKESASSIHETPGSPVLMSGDCGHSTKFIHLNTKLQKGPPHAPMQNNLKNKLLVMAAATGQCLSMQRCRGNICSQVFIRLTLSPDGKQACEMGFQLQEKSEQLLQVFFNDTWHRLMWEF